MLIYRKPLGLAGAIAVIICILVGIFADQLAPYHYATQVGGPYMPPNANNLLGTDSAGRDVLSRLIYASRTAMLIGWSAVTVSSIMKITLGISSAWFGGWFDLIFQRIVDAIDAFPSLVLLLTIITVLGTGFPQLILALSLSTGITGSRLIRSAALSVKENQYVDAARAMGATARRIMFLYILPNCFAAAIVQISVNLGGIILAEASLSFLGFGVPQPYPSWGFMLSSDGRNAMLHSPWLAIFPGIALSLVVFGFNMFGDALRDVLDPRLRGGR
jgi:peptide/nickel transport system permease protein